MHRRYSTNNLETPEPSEGGNNPDYSVSCEGPPWDDELTEAEIDPSIQLPADYATSVHDPESFWEDMWKKFYPYMKPYESDRNNYRLYERPLVVECHIALWQRLVRGGSHLRSAVDGFMLLGLIPVDMKEVDPAALTSSPADHNPDTPPTDEQNGGGNPLNHGTPLGSKSPSVGVSPPLPSAAGRLPTGSNSSSAQFSPLQPRTANNYRDATVTMNTTGVLSPPSSTVIRFQVVVDQVTRNRATVSFDDPPEPQPGDKIRELEMEVKELTRQLRLMKSREKSPGPGAATAGGQSNANLQGVGGGSASGRETQGSVARDSSFGFSAPGSAVGDSRSSSPQVPPVPQIVNTRPYVASIYGNTPVCLQLNYLDPDGAPFHISVAFVTGKQILPSSVVNHRYLVFVAPAHPGGSVAATVMCSTANGSLRKYAKACWIEYKDLGGQGLSHHAVNQLVSDIPLAPHGGLSATAPDASEIGGTEIGGTEGGKSEGDGALMEDVETATALSADLGGSVITPGADHPPLTREMLDMLSGPRAMFAAQAGGALARADTRQARGAMSMNSPPQSGVAAASPVASRLSAGVNTSGTCHGTGAGSVTNEPPESEDGRETIASSLAITHVTHGGSVINDVVSVSQATSVSASSEVGDER